MSRFSLLTIVGVAFLGTACCLGAAHADSNGARRLQASCPNVTVAANFELVPYMGVWYEIADSKDFKEFFEDDLYCTTANYTLETAGYVQVDNSGRYKGPTGKLKAAIGKGMEVDGAKLKVSFGGPVYAPYWVIDLMGEASDGFSVALVWSCTDILNIASFKNLWVLSRTPTLPAGVTLDKLYSKAQSMGIDVHSLSMLPTPQPSNCLY